MNVRADVGELQGLKLMPQPPDLLVLVLALIMPIWSLSRRPVRAKTHARQPPLLPDTIFSTLIGSPIS